MRERWKYMKLWYRKLAWKFIKLKSNAIKIFTESFLPVPYCDY
jgi:hypothetical protein